jgi:hypothetical protein
VRKFLHVCLKTFAAVSLLSFLAACGGGGGDDPAPTPAATSSTPWTTTVMMGNFTLNSGDVMTTQDGVSVNYLTDYVNEAAFPNVNFEYLTLNAYIPTTDAHSITVTVTGVEMHNEAGQSTGNIYYSTGSAALPNVTINGQRYAVFRLAGVYNGSGALGTVTRSNFANIVYTFQARYSSNGQQVATRTVNLEVYKR